MKVFLSFALLCLASMGVLSCGDREAAVSLRIGCDQNDYSDIEPNQYNPGLSISYHHDPILGGSFVALTRGEIRDHEGYQRERHYGACRAVMPGGLAQMSSSSLGQMEAFIECFDDARVTVLSANSSSRAVATNNDLDMYFSYGELDEHKNVTIHIGSGHSSTLFTIIQIDECHASGPLVDWIRKADVKPVQ